MRVEMTLDDAIEHCNDVANNCKNKSCANDHLQLAEWLMELKKLKEENNLK
jgi:hypothetical protein